jgi:hypothetical protein
MPDLIRHEFVMPDLIRHPPFLPGQRREEGGPRIKSGVTIPAELRHAGPDPA